MAKSKRTSASKTATKNYDLATLRKVSAAYLKLGPVDVPKLACKDHFSMIEPQINAEGVHLWPFDVSSPVDVLSLQRMAGTT